TLKDAHCYLYKDENGIRYRNVTGVQTCALPILNAVQDEGQDAELGFGGGGGPFLAKEEVHNADLADGGQARNDRVHGDQGDAAEDRKSVVSVKYVTNNLHGSQLSYVLTQKT